MGQICAQCGHVHDQSFGSVCPALPLEVQGSFAARLTAINDDELLVGSVVADRYHVGDVIGQGTTGTVFAAEHLSFARGAALKVLRPRYATPDLIHRVFHGEAKAAWRVVHPCLVEVIDVGTIPDGSPFFVMEPLQGETLATRLRREERLSLASAVDVMMQLLSALEAIHAKDQLLRDLHPQNVYLAQRRGCRPVVKILDFGLARLVPLERLEQEWNAQRRNPTMSDAGMHGALAIPYYLSPERTRGEHALSVHSDLFVVASIFYESLTGERPFVSPTFGGLLQRIARGEPTPLDELRPDVPADLATLVARALAASPLSRPVSAKEMQDELRSIFEGSRRDKQSMSMRSSPSGSMGVASVTAVTNVTAMLEAARADSIAAETSRDVAAEESEIGTLAYSPADQEPHTIPPSHRNTDLPSTEEEADPYNDQTEMSQKLEDATVVPISGQKPLSEPRLPAFASDDSAISAVPVVVDEASADNPLKTIRPPEIGIDVEFEPEVDAPTTSRENELDAFVRELRAVRAAHQNKEEEETETMQLTPELRARIEQMARAKESSPPPPTRKLSKPPR